MLVAAALVPETALLVPGASGATEVLHELRADALGALRDVLVLGPDRVVVVAATASPAPPSEVDAASLAAAGIADERLGWPTRRPAADRSPAADGARTDEVGAAVAVLALFAAGWSGPVTVAPVGAGAEVATLAARGRDLAAGTDRVALVLAGSLSARRGPAGPLPDDVRAVDVEASVLADLAHLDHEARRRLSAVPGDLAQDLAVSAWAPWQVLLGAAPGRAPVRAEVLRAEAPFGATYAVAVWTWT